ncbi:hypothetical protein [Streptomyces sp. AC550_RSS872]|uniref:hypothetical protein n=1 Tax=Streptomyces sp. AC550_RSS872 TaxID=2823689 RepID=UPI001C2567E9|nr:hypothetical protein [Streptomyces sp. AC550_RSS872]
MAAAVTLITAGGTGAAMAILSPDTRHQPVRAFTTLEGSPSPHPILDAVADRIPHEVSHSRVHGLAVVPAGYQCAADRCETHEANDAAHACRSPETDHPDDSDRAVTDLPADRLAQ